MKFLHVLLMLFVAAGLSLFACKSDSPASGQPTDGAAATPDQPAAAPDASMAQPSAEMPALPAPGGVAPVQTATAAAGVYHYECPKKCKGGGAADSGNCPVCGTALVHNQAYHAQNAGATPAPSSPSTPITMPAPGGDKPPSPAQNAAGVYHYTCPKGCAGGAGAAGKCAKCGGDLAHNQAYHQ